MDNLNISRELVTKFLSTISDDGIYIYRAPFSPLFIFVSWTEKNANPYIDSLALNKGRDTLFVLNEKKYFSYAYRGIEDYFKNKSSIDILRKNYDLLDQELTVFYENEVVLNVSTLASNDLAQKMNYVSNLLTTIASQTLYTETVDKEMVIHVLGEKKRDLIDSVWQHVTEPTFLSFEGRRLKYMIDLLEREANLDRATNYAVFIFTDYWWPKSHDKIRQELDKVASNLEGSVRKYEVFKQSAFVRKEKYIAWYGKALSEEKNIADYIQLVMHLRNLRKDSIAKCQALMSIYASELSRRCGISAQAIPLITSMEYSQGVDFIKKQKSVYEKRIHGFVYTTHVFGEYNFENGSFVELLDLFESRTKKNLEVSIIKGKSASKGRVVGKVKIILDPSIDIDFKEGDILVTSMTRPEFVPLMKKSAAVVTNEGGITCHAAIVSREIGIPCVIATKNATQILKDGDLVEVDADTGVVTILKRK